MAEIYTGNYHLRKPQWTDNFDRESFNEVFGANADTIDTELKRLSDGLEAAQTPSGSGTDDGLQSRVRQLEEDYEALLELLNEANSGGGGTDPGTGNTSSVDLSGINSAVAQLNSTVSGLQATVEGYGTRLSALEAWRAEFTETASGSGNAGGSSSGSDSGGSTGGVDTSGLAGQILALRRNVESDMLIMSNRLVLLESAAFTDFSVDETDYKWYARNIKGIAVDGPFEFGFVNSSKSLAELLGLTSDSGDSGNSSGGIVLEPEEPRSLAEIFGFVIE